MNASNSNQSCNTCSFLSGVASAYLSRYEEMTDVCFVFPNKRSRSFFLKSLAENLGEKVMIAPEVMDISEFMGKISGLEAAPRIDTLFRLYNVYCGLIGRSDSLMSEDDLLDFDRFASWGEVVINDFSEVEQFCADAEKLFNNVRDYRNISSNFLTEKQLDVIERYFGYRPIVEDAENFWKSVYNKDELSKLKEKFVELWKLMPELFEGLIENLKSDGLGLEGTIFRVASDVVETKGREALPWSHVVVVGFNMLSTAEMRLFENLRDMVDEDGEPYCDFYWDATGPVLDGESAIKNAAATDLRRYKREFPMPQWAESYMQCTRRTSMPESITISAAPSNVAQTKIAARVVEKWKKDLKENEFGNAKVAIVVPDENLLLPLLHSLPPDIEKINLTMGYPMRFTAIASFIYYLKRLQTRRRKIGEDTGYFHEDLKLFMSHPLVHLITGSKTANKIISEISRTHIRVVTTAWIAEYSKVLANIIRPIAKDSTVDQTVEYLENVLMILDKALLIDSNRLPTFNSKLERSQTATYLKSIITLLNSVKRNGISMSYTSVFHLIERLVSGEKVNFEGKPLEGLQIMGLLETRAIDFDYVIIMSMNDKIMPRRARKRTFIPDSLRHSYGLPTSSKSEELYSYYFYRLLSRASHVGLIYDARAGEGMRSGGKSRYLMQLELLYARDMVRKENFTFMLDAFTPKPEGVEKTQEVMDQLALYLKEEDGKNLSASALMNYCTCQVKFYYKNVVGISDDIPSPGYIDAITQGLIVHRALLELYFPKGKRKKYLKSDKRIILTSNDLNSMLQNRDLLWTAVTRAVNREHYKILNDKDLDRPLEGSVKMVAERLLTMVEDVISHDAEIAPLELVGGEIPGNVRWKAGNSPEVNIKYSFDRVDRVNGKLRIIDYKTGKSEIKAKGIDEVFEGSSDSKYIIQLLLYSRLLEDRVKEEDNQDSGDIDMIIYDVNNIVAKGEIRPQIGKEIIKSHRHKSAKDEFINRMEQTIKDIFDRSKPFKVTDDEKNCKYCNLKALCGRQ